MTTAASSLPHDPLDERTYRRRSWAWILYDWANSAFVTTVLAAVLPIYFSQVAGANLPSEAVATGYFSLGASIALLIAAVISPILGTVSDVVRGKKRFLTFFAGIGIIASAGLAFTTTGDWLLVLIIVIIGRVGFQGSISFYDSLLPHVAREADRDRISATGYALGYLGGGILLAINVVMLFQFGFETGAKLSFISVAIWWAVFSLPVLLLVPEPPAATVPLKAGENVISASFKRIQETLRDIGKYRELVKFLIAFLIFNDAINTIITTATIYGTELGFEATSLIVAILLVQFVGIPFSLIFGGLPNPANKRRSFMVAFIVFNLVALPLAGIAGARVLPQNITGVLLPPYETTANGVGTGVYGVDELPFTDGWISAPIPAAILGAETDVVYASTSDANARFDFAFNGQAVELTHGIGPNYGVWAVLIDGQPLTEAGETEGETVPVLIDAYHETVRYGETATFAAAEGGEHILSLVNTGTLNANSVGNGLVIAQMEVQSPVSESSLPTILGVVVAVQIIGLVFAFVAKGLFTELAHSLDTKRSIVLALVVYAVISVWGFFLNSTIEFWFLAWMVAIVQGGSQALSRSLFASMSPASKSGEFFGVFGVMEKFASFLGPLIFSFAALNFGSSRPAILSLILFFIVGGFLLMRVNVDEGRRVAQEEDKEALGGAA